MDDPLADDCTAFRWHGPPDAPAVVLIHGLGLNRKAWQWQVPALAGRFRVLTYDLYGHGESRAPPSEPSLTLFSDQIDGLLGRQGVEHAAIVGFSLGGMIARRFAMDRPRRTGALAILNSPHSRSPEAQQAILDRVAEARARGPAATVEAALMRWFTPECRRMRPELMDEVRNWVLANDREVYPEIYRVLAEGVAELVAPDPPISCPTLVLTASDDFGNGPEMSRAIASEIPGAELVILEGLRHMALAEAPERVNAPLSTFLERALISEDSIPQRPRRP